MTDKSNIHIGKVGFIRSGEDMGSFVKIDELPDNPPSYLILISESFDFRGPGADYWVEDKDSLIQFFAESRWQIDWR